ncbi:hypothetical protein EW146_g2338 [Bondarzewia mesenterica]|uniref:Transmembrane protein n=1 Tax=Bondarzewia mesenterica TaxID=1095465 RepID=A0A4S4M0Z7_9AGAM|nr:hypothetical protein EW146_g2338 [Bondarzewia mesenterica]
MAILNSWLQVRVPHCHLERHSVLTDFAKRRSPFILRPSYHPSRRDPADMASPTIKAVDVVPSQSLYSIFRKHSGHDCQFFRCCCQREVHDFIRFQSCRLYALFRQLLIVANQVVVCFLLIMRTYALYGRSAKIFALLLTIGLVMVAIASWALVGQSSDVVPNVQGCHLTMSDATGIRVAVAWEEEFVLDMIIFGLTVARTYQHRDVRTWSRGMGPRNTGLMQLFLRDGALYFVMMALANLLNILTFYLAPPILKGVLSTFSTCISVTMMSRLMLNLHEAVAAPSTLVTTHEVEFAVPREDDDPTSISLHTFRPSLPNVEARVDRSTSPERFESEASRQERDVSTSQAMITVE